MNYTKLYINLERSPERRKKFDDTWTRITATDGNDLDHHPILKRMVSMWNMNPKEHRAKCACFLSHYRTLEYIVGRQLNNVIVCEDDAIQINELPPPERLGNHFCYLGGYFCHRRITDGHLKDPDDFPISSQGLNGLDRSMHRLMMMLSYYIPSWKVAENMLEWLESCVRLRAMDTMLFGLPYPVNYYYPAIFVEDKGASTIHTNRIQKHPNTHYAFT